MTDKKAVKNKSDIKRAQQQEAQTRVMQNLKKTDFACHEVNEAGLALYKYVRGK